jgi:hypothetical protein
MAKFTASDQLEPREYDFRPYADAQGTVPEPTDDQVAEFYSALNRQFQLAFSEERLEGIDTQDPYDVAKLVMSLDADENRALYDAMLDVHADVCSGQPSVSDLAALPFRLRRAFYGAVQGWLRPEALTPATND